ncbi:terminase small subunit [Colwellia sp. C1TZA3]|uniref:terminase small subunit n=1 Tax=Colwellia sp. C1TZA3 TaxID=2508879 RepID=UPI0011B97289|nr:terminase small subunit [Colwellia sp. C1TZA3]TWX73154.1 hypothetical protein ESZ39_05125 [Colwellia sp. C1TZA3]
MARPTKYNTELLIKADEYLKLCESKKQYPTICTLVKLLGIGRRTFYDLKLKHDTMANIHTRICDAQTNYLSYLNETRSISVVDLSSLSDIFNYAN